MNVYLKNDSLEMEPLTDEERIVAARDPLTTPELHIPVENEHLFRFKMNADSGLRVHRFRTPQSTYSDVR